MWLLFVLSVVITSLGFVVFLWVQNNKIPCTSLTLPYSPVFKIYSESDLLLPLPLLPLWSMTKAHRHLIFILDHCCKLLTGCCSVSIFVSLQNPHAIGSFQNAGQIMSHLLPTQGQHPRPRLTHLVFLFYHEPPAHSQWEEDGAVRRGSPWAPGIHLHSSLGARLLCLLFFSRSWTVSVAA